MENERVSFFKNLLNRRVPQILGGYLAGSWIVLEFLDWLVRRYPVSPHLVDFCLVILASLIPTVILLSYYHGRPGKDQWTRVEKIGIPTNIVISVAILVFLFRGEDLGATTTTVTLMDESGAKIERSVPKSEFRKSLIIFSLENNSGDSIIEWISHAVPGMLQYDLSQDIYLNIGSTFDFYDDIKDAGFPDTRNIPMTLMRKISMDNSMDIFASGKLDIKDNQFNVTLTLHNTKTSKTISEKTYTGENIFNLVDQASSWIKESMEIPKWHIEQTEDLPVSEILTKSIPALKYFYNGLNKITLDDDWEEATKQFELAVEEDETFAFAYLNLYICYAYTGQVEKYRQTFKPLMKYLYKMPERIQFAIKHDYYYGIKQDPEMAFEVGKNWVDLYPDDIKAHTVLALLYRIRNQKENELAEYKEVLSLDPDQHELYLEIGEIYRDMGNFDEALKYYQQYADEFPNNLKSYIYLGNLHRTFGDYEQARTLYKKALLVEPDDISVKVSIAGIDAELGKFSEALDRYQQLLEESESPDDRYSVLRQLENYYYMRGKLDRSVEYMEQRFEELSRFIPFYGVLTRRFQTFGRYVLASQSDKALDMVQSVEEQLGPPLDMMVPYGYLDIYIELGDIEQAEKYLAEAELNLEAMQSEIDRTILLNAQGRIHELKGEYQSAIVSYLKQIEMDPTNTQIDVCLGRCYRLVRDYKKAEEHLQKALRFHPFWPDANYEMALVIFETGEAEEALEYMKRVQLIWENADPDYEPAIKCREKLAEIEKSIN
jgi:tetratricopeptide (TPR) repeat protein